MNFGKSEAEVAERMREAVIPKVFDELPVP